VGVLPRERSASLDEALPILRSLLAGQPTDVPGPVGVTEGVVLDPLPIQQPLEIWLGGMIPSALERCGRFSDGWLPTMITPDEAAQGRVVVEQAAGDAGRQIDAEHFGMSIAYSIEPIAEPVLDVLRARAKRDDIDQIVPVGLDNVRRLVEAFVEQGFSKFVLRPLNPPASWDDELESLSGAVCDLQT
jgi:alkanesulfonate monooxygenase SsuD/methylene tetrahydromethanopterin reductase-like flavin-dependent oxidoreductase (luciferase family)